MGQDVSKINVRNEGIFDCGSGTDIIERELVTNAISIEDFMRDVDNDIIFDCRYKQKRNVAVSNYYQNMLNFSPKNEWAGKYRTAFLIVNE